MKTVLRENPLFLPYLHIDGAWLNTNQQQPLYAPYTRELLAQCPIAEETHCDAALCAAQRAFLQWRTATPNTRAAALMRWYDAVCAHTADLAELITHELGMPITQARSEIQYAASFIRWSAECLLHTQDHLLPNLTTQQMRLVHRRPVGICGIITPFNLPASMITKKVAAAIAAGCSVIIKPSDMTPLTACALVQLAQISSAFPPGLINLLIGDAALIGRFLTTHPAIAMVSFTGSTATGQRIAQQSAPTLKKLSLELGGNAFGLILPDADLTQSISAIAQNKQRGSGQICVAINRIYLLKTQAPAFIEGLMRTIQTWRIGPPTEENTDIGPLINEQACQKVMDLITQACDQGAECLYGGQTHPDHPTVFLPTILTNVTHQMSIAHTEIFGPVFPIYLFDQEQDMIEAACALPSGLCNYLFTRDITRALQLQHRITSGMLVVNSGSFSHASVPFGGVHESGQGREGSFLALDDYSYTQYSCIHW